MFNYALVDQKCIQIEFEAIKNHKLNFMFMEQFRVVYLLFQCGSQLQAFVCVFANSTQKGRCFLSQSHKCRRQSEIEKGHLFG